MKTLLAFALLANVSLASEEVLLTCTRTAFSDIDRLVVTASDRDGEVLVYEYDEQGNYQVFARDEKSFRSGKELELSSWYGYSRKLYQDGSGWNIEHHDECSGGISAATCE